MSKELPSTAKFSYIRQVKIKTLFVIIKKSRVSLKRIVIRQPRSTTVSGSFIIKTLTFEEAYKYVTALQNKSIKKCNPIKLKT